MDLCETFKTEADCIRYFIDIHFGGKIECPYKYCDSKFYASSVSKVYSFKDGKTFKCSCCKKRFSVRVGTIFEDLNIPLRKWFMATYLITSHKKGISSVQLGKDIGVTQKSAWFMLHRLRHASKTKPFAFEGTVEADETFVGGKYENMHADKKATEPQKAIVLGMLNRETKQVKSVVVASTEYHNLGAEILNTVQMGANLITDGHTGYEALKMYYKHDSVNHSAKEHVRIEEVIKEDDSRESVKIHTNTVEGFWGLVKKTIKGTYHWVSKKHLQKYLGECDFRYNTKEFETESARFDCFLQNRSSKLSYKTLIA